MTYALTVIEPTPFKAGTVEDEPFFFDCAKCGTHGQPDRGPIPIAGLLSSEPEYHWEALRIVDLAAGGIGPALYCDQCWPAELARLQAA